MLAMLLEMTIAVQKTIMDMLFIRIATIITATPLIPMEIIMETHLIQMKISTVQQIHQSLHCHLVSPWRDFCRMEY